VERGYKEQRLEAWATGDKVWPGPLVGNGQLLLASPWRLGPEGFTARRRRQADDRG
jgi:hypothetical protein